MAQTDFLRTQVYLMHWFERHMTEATKERRETWREEREPRPAGVAEEETGGD